MTSAEMPGDPSARVQVSLSGDDARDAGTVLRALHTAYPSDRSPDDLPDGEEGRTTIWSAVFDTSDPHGEPAPARLDAPVTATLQGGYRACDTLCATLRSAFDVKVVGTASGDQEEEMHLSLASR